MRVIGMLLGIPDADQPAIRDRSDDVIRTKPGQPMRVNHNFLAGEMFEEYIDWRAEHPSDDLMTELLNAEFEDETGTTRRLTRDEVLIIVNVIAGAGNETTTRLIGWAGKVLAEHPDQRAELAASIVTSAFAPTNTLMGNPAALAKTIETGGSNLTKGLAAFLDDIKNNGGLPKQVDNSKFEVGGNLAESLLRLGEGIRGRLLLRERIEALTSQGKLQGLIVGLLPVFLLIVLGFMEPEAMRRLYQTHQGWAALGAMLALEVTGFVLIRRIVSIEV